MKTNITYIVSNLNKGLAFEWIAEKLNKEKFELSFILLNNGNSLLESNLLANKITVTRIQLSGKKSWPLIFFKLVSIFKKHKPDIIHCHLLEASILGLLAGKLTGIKKRIFTRHHSSQHHVYHKKGVFWDKLCNYLATNIVAVTRKVKEILIDWEKAEPKKIMVINHGFELKGFDNNNEELILNQKNKYNRDNQFPVIGVVSRFTELKGIQYIIPAFQNLLVDFPQAKILFFNALGDYNFEILELLKTLPANSYQLVKYEENMFLAYRLFDVYIHVPINDHCEAFGQTYIEALAAGVPSIFTLSGIATEFIKDRENALVVDYMNASDIYASMKLLIKDEALAKRISSQGRKDVDAKFDLSIMIKKLESLYQNQIICE